MSVANPTTETSDTRNEKVAVIKSFVCVITVGRSNAYSQKITDEISIGAEASFKEIGSVSSN